MTRATPADTYLPPGRSFQPIGALVLPVWNPRTLYEADFRALCESIKRRPEFLIRRPILVADGPQHRAGAIVHGGNQRTRAVEHLFKTGWQAPWPPDSVPVDVADIPEAEAKALALLDNNSAGVYDDELLAELTAELANAEQDLSVLGFSAKEVENLLNHSGSLGDTDNVPRSRETAPAEQKASDAYDAQQVRQLVLYYPKADFPAMLLLLDWLREHFAAETNAEAVASGLLAYQASCQAAST